MKKITLYPFLFLLVLLFSAFSVHKFYMAIYQVDFVPEKKRIQITARIFVDDLDKALEKKFQKKINLGDAKAGAEELILLQKYLNENFSIKVNGQAKEIRLLSKELDADVLVCYLVVKEVSKINTLEIRNVILLNWIGAQQNIMHFNVLGVKNSLLFSESSNKEVLKYD
jgi:uncharacterized membrane protein